MRVGFHVAARLAPIAGVTATIAAIGLFILAGAPTDAFAEDKPSVESILERYVEAVGGRDAIEKLSSRVCTGKRITDLTTRQQPIYEPKLSYEGRHSINGMETHALKPASLQPEYYMLYFSVESGLLVGIGYYRLIEDYREVDGVLFPHRISTGRKGGLTVYDFEKVTHGTEIGDSLFVMPPNPR